MKYIGIGDDNSYLLSNTVIECVSKENAAKHIENIKSYTDRLDYIILNHTSPENIGSLELLLTEFPSARVVTSAAGIKNITEQLNRDIDYILAKDGMELYIDDNTAIKFFILPNLPWTDSMASYFAQEKILFSGSIFEAKNKRIINNKYSDYAVNAVTRLKSVEINRIISCFGDDITDIDGAFNSFAEKHSEDFVAVFYSSYYGYTKEMAQVISKNIDNARCYNVDETDFKELTRAINSCRAFAIGTHTVNRNASPTVLMLLTQIDLVNRKHTPCFVFGSYGWSGEGLYIVERFLKSISMNLFEKPFSVKFKMSGDDKMNLIKHTQRFVQQIN